jgi:hypothetical protein
MAGSVSVAIASNQSSIPVTISEDQNYGTPTATTLRTASMLVMGSTAVSVTNPVFVAPGNGTNSYTSDSISAAQKTLSTATAIPVCETLTLGWDGTTHREMSVTTTGAINVVSSNFPTTLDANYGTPGASTLRTASMLGMGSTAVSATNPVFVELSTGAGTYNTNTAAQLPAALGQTTMASSLSVAIASNQSSIPVSNLPTTTDTNYGAPGASTLRTASMLGMGSTAVSATNPVFVELSTGAGTYNTNTAAQLPAALGQNTMANSLTVAIASNQSSIPVSNLPTTADTNYGIPGTSSLRTASMLGMGSTAVSVTNPVFVEPGNGTNSYSSAAITAAQFTQSTATAIPLGANLSLGWDGTTHREISVSTTGLLGTSLNGLASQNFLALDTSSTNITSAAYVQLFASTTAAVSWVSIFNGSGSVLELATGAAGSEVVQLAVPPGGIEARLAIAASVRVAVRRYPSVSTDMTSGFFTINLLG